MSFRAKGDKNEAFPHALPVYSVADEATARMLQVRLCSLGYGPFEGRYLWPGFYREIDTPEQALGRMEAVARRMHAVVTQGGHGLD